MMLKNRKSIVKILLIAKELCADNKQDVARFSRKIKRELRKHGYEYENRNRKSPYSNSQYFEYWNTNTRGEIRVSDHEYPNHNHTFRGWDLDARYPKDNWEDFVEDLEYYE